MANESAGDGTPQKPVPQVPTSIEIIIIQFADVVIDRNLYQRAPNKKTVREIGADFDADLAGIFTVSIRADGTIAIIDGQHRMLGAIKAGLTSWPARAYRNIPPEQEARLFAGFQKNRTSHKALGLWKAEIAGGNATYRAIRDTVDALGLSVGPGTSDWRIISAPMALLDIATKGGKRGEAKVDTDRLRRVLEFIKICWPDDMLAFHYRTIKGVERFLRKYGERVNLVEAHTKLRAVNLGTVHRKALQEQDMNGMNIAAAFSRALQGYYDRGRRNRLEPRQDED